MEWDLAPGGVRLGGRVEASLALEDYKECCRCSRLCRKMQILNRIITMTWNIDEITHKKSKSRQ